MNRTIRVALVAAAGLLLSACPSKTVQEGAAAIPQASAATCRNERMLLQQAVDSYTLLEGKPPANEAALVPAYIHALSPYMDIDAAGNVVPAPGSTCS